MLSIQKFEEAIIPHVSSYTLYGSLWPEGAVAAFTYRKESWPYGYGDTFAVFFASEKEADTWLKKQLDWASIEGNDITYTRYAWNSGPVVVETR